MLVLLIVGVFIIVASFIIFFNYKKKDVSGPSGPWNLPIIGGLHMLNWKTPYISLTKLAENYGPIYSIKLGKVNTVVISDFKLLKKVLMKDEAVGRPPLYFLDYICQNKGLTYAHVHLCKEQRKFMSEFLRSAGAAKVSSKKELLEKEIKRSIGEFVQMVKSQKEDSNNFLSEAVTSYVSNVTSILFLGKSWSSDVKTKLIHICDQVVKLSVVAGPLNFLPFLRFIPLYANLISVINTSLNKMHSYMDELLKNKRQLFIKEENGCLPTLIDSFMRKSSIRTSDNVYNMEQLQFLITDMFGASTETTVTSILWIILYLAKYEEVQNKVRLELQTVLQGKAPRMEDLRNLPYTEATLAEVARIRTTVAMGVPHLALEDIYIDDLKIEKNTMILPLLWAIHMDSKVWNEPEEFRPDRFLNAEGRFCQPEEFLPFSVGKRMCIGEQLAKMVIFLFVATIFQNFKVKSDGSKIDLSAICGITLLPKPQKVCFIKL